jgi:hypothetical protein
MPQRVRDRPASDSESIKSPPNREFSIVLVIGGAVLLATFLNLVLFSLFPLRLPRPDWQLGVISQLLNGGTTALLGSLFICLGTLFSPRDLRARRYSRLVRRLATFAAIAYLLLIPAQLSAGVKIHQERSELEDLNFKQWRTTMGQIRASTSPEEIRAILSKYPEPPALPPNFFQAPLDTVKQQLLTAGQTRIREVENTSLIQRSIRWQTWLLEVARNSVQSLLLGIGFAAIARPFQGSKSLLELIVPRKLTRRLFP